MSHSAGSTLVELLVAVTIITLVALAASVNIVSFQKNVVLDSAARELAAAIETARSQSVSGVIIEGTDLAYYEPGYLPRYGVDTQPGQYSLSRSYRLSGAAGDSVETLEVVALDKNLTLAPAASLDFSRLTGQASGSLVFTLSQAGSSQTRRITVTPHQVAIEVL